MAYILRNDISHYEVAKISESRKYKGYCSYNCPSCYTHHGEVFCGPFGDNIGKRFDECYEAQKPIEFLLKNKKIKTIKNCYDLKLRSGHEYEFVKFISKGRKIEVVIIGETGSQETYSQLVFDWEELFFRSIEVWKWRNI